MRLPKAITHHDQWQVVELAGVHRVLVISDLHIPYHDERAIQLAVRAGRERSCDTILINGDMMDFYAMSSWETDPRKRNLVGEVNAGRLFLQSLREYFPRARIVLKEGNHEERWERYLIKKAPDLLGLPEFSWQSVFHLDKYRIEHVGERKPIRIGKLIVIHGHEYRFNISNPVNPARGLFLRGKTHAVCGHFHQTSQHSEKRLDNAVVATWSIGALCDLHPDYAPLNNWNHGFAIVDVSPKGEFQIDNFRIIDGKVYR